MQRNKSTKKLLYLVENTLRKVLRPSFTSVIILLLYPYFQPPLSYFRVMGHFATKLLAFLPASNLQIFSGGQLCKTIEWRLPKNRLFFKSAEKSRFLTRSTFLGVRNFLLHYPFRPKKFREKHRFSNCTMLCPVRF